MMKKIIYLLIFSTFLVSCNEYNKILKSDDMEAKYMYAKKCFEEKKYTRAYTLLEDLYSMYQGTARGEESLYLLAMSYYMSKDYLSAGQYFTKYYNTYRKGEYTEMARFYTGYGLYLDSPEARLDQAVTYKAIRELQSFLEYFPKSEKAEEAQKAIIEMQEKLVQKELYNVQLYYNLGNYLHINHYESAVITAHNALKDYPYTKYKEDLYYMILKSKYQEAVNSIEERSTDRYREAVDEYYAYITEFPEGKYLKEAKRIFEASDKHLKD